MGRPRPAVPVRGLRPRRRDIGSVQGSGATSPVAGQVVRVEGVVVGDFQQAGGLAGYFLQSISPDTDTADLGRHLRLYARRVAGRCVSGRHRERCGRRERVCVSGRHAHRDHRGRRRGVRDRIPAARRRPRSPCRRGGRREASRGHARDLLRSRSRSSSTSSSAATARVEVGLDRQLTPTAIVEPGADAIAARGEERIGADHARRRTVRPEPRPVRHPNGDDFSLANDLRAGDQLTNVTGVLDYHFGTWAVQPTEAADYTPANPRPDVPEVGGDLTVASFNVLNYFTTHRLARRRESTSSSNDRRRRS